MAAGENDLTTLDAVKNYLRLNGTDNADELLQTLITSVSAFIETYTERVFKQADYTEERDGISWNAKKIAFANYPVSAVSSVSVTGISIAPCQGMNDFGYRFNDRFLILNGYSFIDGFQNVVLSYTAGYSTIPADLEQACIATVALRYREIERIGQVSKTLSGETVSFSRDAVPADVLITLNKYRKVIPV